MTTSYFSLPGGRYGTERRFEIEIRPEAAVAFVVAKKVSVFLLRFEYVLRLREREALGLMQQLQCL